MIKKTYILLVFMLFVLIGTVKAQPELSFKAYTAYRSGDLQKAKHLIDSAIVDEKAKHSPLTWHVRGFVYKDIYEQQDKKDKNSSARETAIAAFYRSMELDQDTSSQFYLPNRKGIKSLAINYYNDAVKSMNVKEIDQSEKYYNSYKESILLIEPEHDFKKQDIEYYNALAVSYGRVYDSNRDGSKEYLKRAISMYKKVIRLDSNNYGANYNLAIQYYNEGVYPIKQINSEYLLPDVMRIQDETVELFKKALPYMKKAHELNPKRPDTIEGLYGIYLSLHDYKQAEYYFDLLEKVKNE